MRPEVILEALELASVTSLRTLDVGLEALAGCRAPGGEVTGGLCLVVHERAWSILTPREEVFLS